MMFMWLSWGLTTAHYSIRTTSDLDQSRLTDTRTAENDRIGADTDPEYQIDASQIITINGKMNVRKCKLIFPTNQLQQNIEILAGENTSVLIIFANTIFL